MSSNINNRLTDEQMKRMEENRKRALELLQRKKVEREAHAQPSLALAGSSCSFPSTSDNKKLPLKASCHFKMDKSAVAAKFELKLSIIRRGRFVVEVGFMAELVQIFKTLKSRNYIKQIEPLRKTGMLHVEEIPVFVRRSVSSMFDPESTPSSSQSFANIDLRPINSQLLDALFPYQKTAVCFAVSRNGRVLFADEMGLGKTVQAIAVTEFYREDWPVLVACPSSLRYNWAEAFKRWLPWLDESDVYVINNQRDYIPDDKRSMVCITSYDMLTSIKDTLERLTFGMLILDESHNIKNMKTQRYRSTEPLAKAAKRVILLSGTPALSRPEELYSQIRCIRPTLFPNFFQYGTRYCNAKQSHFGWNFGGASNMDELRVVLEETIMIRRTKQDVLSELPEKTRDAVVLDKQSVKTNLKQLQNAKAELERGDLVGVEKRGALLNFYAETALAKLNAVKCYILEALETIPKMLVFAHHQVLMDELSMAFTLKDIKFIRIDGSTASLQRKELCDTFQTDDETAVALLSITAANTGLTLTAANVVIFAELFWNPGIMVQAEDRVHRIGQTEAVQIRYLVARGTADDYLWPLLKTKLGVLSKAGLTTDDFGNATTVLIEDIFRENSNSSFVSIENGGDESPVVNSPTTPCANNNNQRSVLDYFVSIADEPLLDSPVLGASPDSDFVMSRMKRRKVL